MPYGDLATIDPASIIARIAAGEYLSHIAQSLKVAPQSLHEHVRDHPGYKSAMQIRHQLKLDSAEQSLVNSPDLARAREVFRAAAWRAERECKAVWGASTEISGSGGGPLQIEIVRYGTPATIEGDVVPIQGTKSLK